MVPMSTSYNRATIMGNLAQSPELRYLPGGEKAVVEVSVAVNERYKKNDEWVETVSFIPVVFWGRTAEVVNEFLEKGSPILVEGRLKQDTWEKDGKKFSKIKLVAEQMKMVGGKKANDNQSSATSDEETLVSVNATSGDQQF